MSIKNWIKGSVIVGAGVLLAACGANETAEVDAESETTLTVGATNVPMPRF